MSEQEKNMTDKHKGHWLVAGLSLMLEDDLMIP